MKEWLNGANLSEEEQDYVLLLTNRRSRVTRLQNELRKKQGREYSLGSEQV